MRAAAVQSHVESYLLGFAERSYLWLYLCTESLMHGVWENFYTKCLMHGVWENFYARSLMDGVGENLTGRYVICASSLSLLIPLRQEAHAVPAAPWTRCKTLFRNIYDVRRTHPASFKANLGSGVEFLGLPSFVFRALRF